MKNVLLLTKIILILAFSCSIFEWAIAYSQLVKIMGWLGFGLLAFHAYKESNMWFFIWLGSAILILPIIVLKLEHDIWQMMSVVWTVILIMSIFIRRIT